MQSEGKPHRVLFVDDEKSVLEAMSNSLYKLRKQWDLHFANSAAEALAWLAEHSATVIVSDVRMPETDGIALLTEVQRLYPNTARVLLSGQADTDRLMESVSVAHQFLRKPCDPEVVQRALRRVSDLQLRVAHDTVRELVAKLKVIPVQPKIFLRLTQMLERDDVALKDIAALIEQDMGITTKVLQVVNSAFFGAADRITQVEAAVTRLGTNVLRGIVLSVEALKNFQIPSRANLSMESLHRNGLRAGLVARTLMSGKGTLLEEAYLAGLLHDIGKVVIACSLPEEYRQFGRDHGETKGSLAELERAAFGVDHGAVGAYLLGLWGLPNEVVDAVSRHDDPKQLEGLGLEPATAVFIAQCFVQAKQTSDKGGSGSVGISEAELERMKVSLNLKETQQKIQRYLEAG